MKKIITFSVLLFIAGCAFGGQSKDAIEKSSVNTLKQSDDNLLHEKVQNGKCNLTIPENIKKAVPKDMWSTVFLQLLLNLIKTEYVHEMTDMQITEKTIDGLLSSLDIHSSYLNEKAFKSLMNQTDGEFGGLGIEIIMDEGFVRIISPIDDTPAYKAGIKSGDVIVYVDDECINGLSSEEVLEKLRGKPGSKVKLKIKRGDKLPFDLIITRDLIKIQSVKTEILENIGYVRISTFDKNTSVTLKKFLNENKNIKGIILDMRDNPGGLLDEAVSVANMFLKGGKIVSIRGRIPENTASYSADNQDITNGLPLVVLINNGTASAPEIVAGALQDNKRAILVGTRSFGKGSVQKVIPISEKTAIKLTVAKHFTPSGRCIQAKGISPDITVAPAIISPLSEMFIIREEFFPNALDGEKYKIDKKKSDLENKKALDNLSKKKDSGKNDKEDEELLYRKLPLSERRQKDYQLSRAFDIIGLLGKLDIAHAKTK